MPEFEDLSEEQLLQAHQRRLSLCDRDITGMKEQILMESAINNFRKAVFRCSKRGISAQMMRSLVSKTLNPK